MPAWRINDDGSPREPRGPRPGCVPAVGPSLAGRHRLRPAPVGVGIVARWLLACAGLALLWLAGCGPVVATSNDASTGPTVMTTAPAMTTSGATETPTSALAER
jgi:hypothetical protein